MKFSIEKSDEGFSHKKNIQISMDSVGRWADKSEAIATHSNKNKFRENKSEAIATHSNKNKFREYNIYIERFW